MDARELAGSVITISGASSGIGAATARSLAKAGARVVLGARGGERLHEVAAQLGDSALAVPTDVRESADARRLIDTAVDRYGKLDSLVVSAGIGAYGSVLDHSDAELEAMIETNVTGTIWTVRAAVPHLMVSGGDIVIVASVAGLRGGGHEAVYAATKFAQVGFAGALDRELRERGVRVSLLCPAAVQTSFAMGYGRTADMPWLDEVLQPEDVAHAIETILRQPRRMRTQLWSMWSMVEAS